LGDGTQVVTLSAEMQPQHCRMRRAVCIPAEGARFSVESSLTNIGDHADELALRVHPQFACKVLPSTSVGLLQADGTWRAVALPLEGQADRFFSPGEAAGGRWALLQPAEGWGIVQTFEPAQVSKLLLNSDASEGRVNMELFSQTVDLAPEQTIRLSHSYELVSDLSAWSGVLQQP